jgi:raffinose/stachyose/melibiose transport system permease protein
MSDTKVSTSPGRPLTTGGPPPAAPQRRRRSPRRIHWSIYLFPLPAVALTAVFLIVPLVQSFEYALTDWDGYSAAFNWVGLDNFTKAIFDDSLFQNSVVNTLKFSLVVVIIQTALSLLLAILLVRNSRSSVWLRSLYFFPTILSGVAIGFIWQFIYDPSFGLVHGFLEAIGLGAASGSYLGDAQLGIVLVAITQVWFHAGQLMVVFIAGLQGIPRELYEAAEMDGASRWRQFRSITWPMIAPAMTIVVAFTTIQCFKAFDLILGIAGSPTPSNLDILSTRIYTSFANNHYGYASAESIIFMVIVGIVVYLQRRALKFTQATE